MSKKAQLPDGTILEFPDNTPQDVMDRAVKDHIAKTGAPSPTRNTSGVRGIANIGMEAIAGLNRGPAAMIDAVIPGNPLTNLVGRPGDFAGDGLASRAAGTAGEFAGLALPAGMATRGMLSLYDKAIKVANSAQKAGITERFFRFLGSTSATDDILGGGLSGAGTVLGGEGAADLFGEDMRGTGEVVGGLSFPLVGGAFFNLAKNITSASQRLLNQATPSIEELAGARKANYALLGEAGIKADVPSRGAFRDLLDQFATDNNIDYRQPTTSIATAVSRLRKAAQNDDLSYGLIFEVSSDLKKISRQKAGEVSSQSGALANIIEEFAYGMDIPEDARRQLLGNKTIAEIKRTADDLYNREKTYEAINFAMEEAKRKSSGFEANKTFTQAFESELKMLTNPNKKSGQALYLTNEQRSLIRKIYDPDSSFQKKVAALRSVGFNSDDMIRSALLFGAGGAIVSSAVSGGSMTMASAGAVGGAAAVTALQTIRKASQSAVASFLRKNTEATQQMIRAGTDANAITRAYMANTKPGERSPEQLAQLLIGKNVDNLASYSNSKLVKDSKFLSDAVFLANYGFRLIREEEANGDVPAVPQRMR